MAKCGDCAFFDVIPETCNVDPPVVVVNEATEEGITVRPRTSADTVACSRYRFSCTE